jgi:hypothetical protein
LGGAGTVGVVDKSTNMRSKHKSNGERVVNIRNKIAA